MSRHFETAPGLNEARDPATQDFVFNQTMLRIKDPAVTLDFYTRVMGMTLVKKLDFPEMTFTLYFLAAIHPDDLKQWSDDNDERLVQTFGRPAMLELTHNWGVIPPKNDRGDKWNFVIFKRQEIPHAQITFH